MPESKPAGTNTKFSTAAQRVSSLNKVMKFQGHSLSKFSSDSLSGRGASGEGNRLSSSQRKSLMRLHTNEQISRTLADIMNPSEETTTKLRRLVKSDPFNIFVSFVIFLNAILIGVETDHRTEENAFVWDCFEITLTVIYTLELTLRTIADGRENLRDHWYQFDAFTVIGSLVDLLIGMFGGPTSDVSISILRILRLTKLVRLFRLFKVLRELLLLVNSIASAMRTLVWTWVLLGLVIYVFAIIYTTQLGKQYPENETLQQEFGTVIRSCFTLFAVLTLDWVSTAREIWDVSPAMVCFTLLYITLTAFAIMNVVVAVIVESTMEQAMSNADDKQRQIEAEMTDHASKMGAVFLEADADGSGDMSREEFRKVISNPKIQRILRELELDAYDLEYLFDNLDVDRNGTISLPEFVQGTLQLRGAAKAKRLFELHCDVVQHSNGVNSQLSSLNDAQANLLEKMEAVLSMQSNLSADRRQRRKKEEKEEYFVNGDNNHLKALMVECNGIASNGTAGPRETKKDARDDQSKVLQEDLVPGVSVRLNGLKNSQEFNGKVGLLQVKQNDKGHLLVKLQDDGQEVVIPPGNLQPLTKHSSHCSSTDLHQVIEEQGLTLQRLSMQMAAVEERQRQQDATMEARMKALTDAILQRLPPVGAHMDFAELS